MSTSRPAANIDFVVVAISAYSILFLLLLFVENNLQFIQMTNKYPIETKQDKKMKFFRQNTKKNVSFCSYLHLKPLSIIARHL